MRVKLLLVALLALLSTAACPGPPGPVEPVDEPPKPLPWEVERKGKTNGYQPDAGIHRLTILHTNDIEGQLLEHPRADWLDAEQPPACGGLARLATAISRQRAEATARGATVLLLDAGDFAGGELAQGSAGGKSATVLEVMNRLGYDALTVGAADYAGGPAALAKLASKAQFPFLACNVTDASGTQPPFLLPYTIRTAGPLKVAVIGMLSEKAAELVPERQRGGHRFEAPLPALRATARQIASHDVDIVVLLCHEGLAGIVELVEDLRSLPLIIAGSSDVSLPKGGAAGVTMVATTRGRAAALGQVDMVFSQRTRDLIDIQARVIDLDARQIKPDKAIAKLLSGGGERAIPSATVIRTLEAPLRAAPTSDADGGVSSTPLGNLAADALRAASGANVALLQRVGLRADLSGAISAQQIAAAYDAAAIKPVVAEVPGARLAELLDRSLADKALRLDLSGLELIYDPDRPAGSWVVELRVRGAKLDRSATYKVVGPPRAIRQLLDEGQQAQPLGGTLGELVAAQLKDRYDAAELQRSRIVKADAAVKAPKILYMARDAYGGAVGKAVYNPLREQGKLADPEKMAASPDSIKSKSGKEFDLLVLVGDTHADALLATALQFPKQRYLLIAPSRPEGEIAPNVAVIVVPREQIDAQAETIQKLLLEAARQPSWSVKQLGSE